MALENGTDFIELDAEPAYLDLMIAAPEKIERAVGPKPREIAGAVEALAGPLGEWVGHKALGGAGRVVEIAAGEPAAAQVEITRRAERSEVTAGIEQAHDGPIDRAPDGDDRCLGVAGSDTPRGRPDRGFGGAVEIPYLRAARRERSREVAGQRFAAAEHARRKRRRSTSGKWAAIEKSAPAGGGRLERAHPLLRKHLGEAERIFGDAALGKHQPGSHGERKKDFEQGDVEADRGDGEQYVRFGKPRLSSMAARK